MTKQTMTIPQIIAKLTCNSGVFPRQAVTEAIRQHEEITPELLRILEDVIANIEDIALQSDYMGHIFAMYLLAQFRETRAYPLLVEFVTADWKHVDRAMGDVVTEDLGRILASVSGGDISLICGMVENADLNEYVRGAALEALVVLVAEGVEAREDVMAYFRSLFHGKLERKWGLVWSSLGSHCCDLCAGEVADEIEQAFRDDLIDTTFIGLQWVKRKLAEGKDHALARLAQDPSKRFIGDTAREMAGWSCFQTSSQPMKTPTVQQAWTIAPVRAMPKVGRNAPCSCGSGKKYKKCCGA